MKGIHLLIFLSIFILLPACTDDDAADDFTRRNQINILFSPNGLGDMGYNDQILRGLQHIRKEREDVDIYFHSPSSIEEAERIFSEWLLSETNGQPSLFILATSDYENLANQYLKDTEKQNGKDILLFESKNPERLPLYHFQISMYGASYLAGVTASSCSLAPPLVVLGNSNDSSVCYAADGFADGYGTSVDVFSFADNWSGFAQAGTAYQKMNEWAQCYGFIFPVAGGSNAGVYRYLREYPQSIYTAGMDVDQSEVCTRIVGSVVKYIDQLIQDFILQWIETGTMPEKNIYGLESGYVDWCLSADYKDVFQEITEQERPTAILKEKEYDKDI